MEVDAAGSQKIIWTGINGATLLQGYEDAAEDMTSAVTIKVTGECANASDTITQLIFSIEPY